MFPAGCKPAACSVQVVRTTGDVIVAQLKLPKSISEWKQLPELPMGHHLVVNLGAMIKPIPECRAAGVNGLPSPVATDETGLSVSLPNITVEERGVPRVYRLPLDFGPIVKRLFDNAGRAHAAGVNLLPRYFTLGMREDGAYAIPDGAVGPPTLVTRN